MPQQSLTASDRAPATEADLTDQTIRDWTKEVLTKYVQHFVGEKGWEERGATSPAHVVDCIFSQLQVTLLGYAADMTEAQSKTEQIDRMLRVRKR
jgi:hypothetical protein